MSYYVGSVLLILLYIKSFFLECKKKEAYQKKFF